VRKQRLCGQALVAERAAELSLRLLAFGRHLKPARRADKRNAAGPARRCPGSGPKRYGRSKAASRPFEKWRGGVGRGGLDASPALGGVARVAQPHKALAGFFPAAAHDAAGRRGVCEEGAHVRRPLNAQPAGRTFLRNHLL